MRASERESVHVAKCVCVIVREWACACVYSNRYYGWRTAANSDTWLTHAQEGFTLLMYAIDKDNVEMLKALLARGAKPNSKNAVGARASSASLKERV